MFIYYLIETVIQEKLLPTAKRIVPEAYANVFKSRGEMKPSIMERKQGSAVYARRKFAAAFKHRNTMQCVAPLIRDY